MSDQQILDPAAIESLRSLSPDTDGSFLRELIEIYLKDTPERLADIDAALAKGDAHALMRAAHTIKGSSSNFGAARLAHLAHEIELHGKAGDCGPVPPLLPGLKAEYDLVTQALKQILGT
jgi:HPt (histidine-containing phosphotransfer) domain-containing protein